MYSFQNTVKYVRIQKTYMTEEGNTISFFNKRKYH
jgi:hypothetical protein